MRYLYIDNETVSTHTRLNKALLMIGSRLQERSTVIRIKVPSDLQTKKLGENFITNDTRKIKDIDFQFLVRVDGKWVEHNELADLTPDEVRERLASNDLVLTEKGYLTAERYRLYVGLNEARALDRFRYLHNPTSSLFCGHNLY